MSLDDVFGRDLISERGMEEIILAYLGEDGGYEDEDAGDVESQKHKAVLDSVQQAGIDNEE